MSLGRAFAQRVAARLRRPRARSGTRRHSTRCVVLGGMAIFIAMVLVSGCLTAYLTYRADWNSVRRIDVRKDLVSQKRPPPDPNAMNVLLIGSDSRAGANRQFGAAVQGQRSDTVMIVHIAPGAHQVVVLSFPRDSVVPILSCAPEAGAPGQTAAPGGVEQVNASFAYGGPGCLWKTIEQTTGIHINDFIELTFTGFEHVIDDIGGVNICLPTAVNDANSELHLSAGRHHVYGREALAFWRARYIGEGSDLQRIQRDQYLMAAVLQGIAYSGLLSSPAKLYRVITDIARNHLIATDTGLTPGRLLLIAETLHGLSTKAVRFIEVPSVPYPGNPTAWVQWAEPEAPRLFSAIAHDARLPSAGRTDGSPGNNTPVLASLTPADVKVHVLNGSTVSGLATATSARLAALGFAVVGQPGDTPSPDYARSVIEYPSAAALPAARTLARLISNVRLHVNPGLAAGNVVLILGSTFTGLHTTEGAVPRSSPSPSLQSSIDKYGGISGNVPICMDSSVFAGPDGS
jgi:LCP family protein required for cell wall assembly